MEFSVLESPRRFRYCVAMGLADRDYMKPKSTARPPHGGRPRTGWWRRFKFWLWRVFKGK